MATTTLLPIDMISEIISHVSDEQDFANMSLVCKDFHHCSCYINEIVAKDTKIFDADELYVTVTIPYNRLGEIHGRVVIDCTYNKTHSFRLHDHWFRGKYLYRQFSPFTNLTEATYYIQHLLCYHDSEILQAEGLQVEGKYKVIDGDSDDSENYEECWITIGDDDSDDHFINITDANALRGINRSIASYWNQNNDHLENHFTTSKFPYVQIINPLKPSEVVLGMKEPHVWCPFLFPLPRIEM